MIELISKKIINILIIFALVLQVIIYLYNQRPLITNFSKKQITVENFSTIALSNSGITKIGSEKLNKIDEDNIYLEGKSFLENKEYKIYGNNINISLSEEISSSNEAVEVVNSMGILSAQGFKSIENEGKIIFKGKVNLILND